MAKAKRKKRPDPVQVVEPTPEQLAKGGYEYVNVPHPDGGNRQAHLMVNRGGTPVARWKASDQLSSSQIAAIDHCTRLWQLAGTQSRVTGSYGERIASSGTSEYAAVIEIDARRTLHRIIDYFPGPLRAYWECFENVCRHDMPAGVAGSSLSKSTRTADARAFTVVCFVADTIAFKERL